MSASVSTVLSPLAPVANTPSQPQAEATDAPSFSTVLQGVEMQSDAAQPVDEANTAGMRVVTKTDSEEVAASEAEAAEEKQSTIDATAAASLLAQMIPQKTPPVADAVIQNAPLEDAETAEAGSDEIVGQTAKQGSDDAEPEALHSKDGPSVPLSSGAQAEEHIEATPVSDQSKGKSAAPSADLNVSQALAENQAKTQAEDSAPEPVPPKLSVVSDAPVNMDLPDAVNIAASAEASRAAPPVKSADRLVAETQMGKKNASGATVAAQSDATLTAAVPENIVPADSLRTTAMDSVKADILADARTENTADTKIHADAAVQKTEAASAEADMKFASKVDGTDAQKASAATATFERPVLHQPTPMNISVQTDFSVSAARHGDAQMARPVTPPMGQVLPVIVTMAAQSSIGTQSTMVRMDRENLGKVEVRVHREKESARVQVEIIAERPETLLLLQKDHVQLVRALERIGVDAHESTSFQLASEFSSSDQQENQSADGDARNGDSRRAGHGSVENNIAARIPVKLARIMHAGLNITA